MLIFSKMVWVTTAAAIIACGAVASVSAAQNFYVGKTLTIVVPYGPGGGYDTWARLIAPYMQKYLGAAQVKIENQPGGGGLVGTNAVYHAMPDGLTIGDTNAAGDVFSQIADAPGVAFDTGKFSWIGRPDNDPHIIAVHPNGPYKTFDDIVALKGGKKVLQCLATGKGSSDYNSTVIVMNAFGVPFQMVAAFNGSHEEKATFLAGDGDTLAVSASDIAQVGPDAARIVLLSTTQPFSKLPGVPTVVQEAEKHQLPANTADALKVMAEVMDMGHAFFAPPAVPSDRLETLRTAFAKTFQDKEFLAKAEKAGLYAGYESPAKLQEAAQTAFQHKGEFTPLLKTTS
ncbi:MAG TPA: tripartite tricarboxylate transporter substrate-binding protein [Xanthobacteraceae bacterium]|jgi:tripartite-type tricarboxylate transporter receptor subunit TctC